MKHTNIKILGIILASFLLINSNALAQVGIGTTNPDASSMLDIQSTSKGFLTPRMTTVQKNAISSPLTGLMVYDTDLDKFNYYNGSSWIIMESSLNSRDNYKLVKSTADLSDELTAGGGATYQLSSGTLYEVNGTINLSYPINLNGAYLVGLDTNEDTLISAGGTIFSGGASGSIRNLTLIASGGSVFNLLGSGAENFIFQNCIVANSGSVGTINNYAMVFMNVIQYSGNSAGVIFTDIDSLLLNNIGWFLSNTGTFETYTGTFSSIQKMSGFINVPSGSTGINVSSDPTVTNGVLQGVSFSGAGTPIVGYTTGSYTNYFFTNDWHVDSSGLLRETDGNARGDINLDASVGSGFYTYFTGTGTSSRKKLSGTSASNSLFRFTKDGDNKIIYDGKIKRSFSITAAVSFQGDNVNSIFIFYIAKNGAVAVDTKVFREVGANYDVGAAAIVGVMDLIPGDYIEVWGERYSGAGDVIVVSLNLIIN
jgi:hypothetical protein